MNELGAVSEIGSLYDRFSNLGKFSPSLHVITALGLGCLMLLADRNSQADLPPPIETPRAPKKRRVFHLPTEASFVSVHSSSSASSRPTCSEKEKEMIAEIVNILYDYNMASIVFQQGRLDTLKEQISGVHSLAFLETIFSNEDLKDKVKFLFENSSKILHRNGFMGGVTQGMGSYQLEELDPYLRDWALSCGTTEEAVRPLIEKKNWEGLIQHLLHKAVLLR